MRRIVITGSGLVSPLGCGIELVWKRLLAGQSGIRRLPAEHAAGLVVQIAGLVPTLAEDAEGGFDPGRVITAKEAKRMDRFIQFALAAADEALGQAGWSPRNARERERCATIIGSGNGGVATMRETVRTVDNLNPRKISPFTVPALLANLAAGQISIRHDFRGPIGTPVTACAASLQAIGDGMRLIRSGEADIAVCGGAESAIDRISLAIFSAARALATKFNDTPQGASRPFDMARDGFVLGEGAAVVVIEALEHALARGATPLAELVGYGTTSDAYHMVAVPEDGSGLQRSMKLALAAANISPEEIGYINAHATSTKRGDAAELSAIRRVFKHARPAISATKSSTGHMLGAAGATGLIFAVRGLQDEMLPPTLNLSQPDENFRELDFIGPEPRAAKVEHALVNASAFGGINASVVLRRWTPHPSALIKQATPQQAMPDQVAALSFRRYQLEMTPANGPWATKISAFLHDVYAGELGYYATNEEQRFDDSFRENTSYILALEDDEVVGLQGVISCVHDYPLKRRVQNSAFLDELGTDGVELRLLSIAKDRRKSDIFFAVVVGINHFLRADVSMNFALTSSKAHNVALYEKIGFKTFAQSEVFGSTSYHMHASRATLERMAEKLLRFATR